MGGSPKVIMTDGEGAINNSGLFHKYVTEHKLTYVPSRGHLVFDERMVRTFRWVGIMRPVGFWVRPPGQTMFASSS